MCSWHQGVPKSSNHRGFASLSLEVLMNSLAKQSLRAVSCLKVSISLKHIKTLNTCGLMWTFTRKGQLFRICSMYLPVWPMHLIWLKGRCQCCLGSVFHRPQACQAFACLGRTDRNYLNETKRNETKHVVHIKCVAGRPMRQGAFWPSQWAQGSHAVGSLAKCHEPLDLPP